jgi:PST family polysaccharide transporter
VVARILSPHDYGLMTMATVYLGLVGMLSEFGVGTAILMLRELQPRQMAQLNSLVVLLGVACLLLSLVAAWPLGAFYRAAELPAVIRVMSLTFLINALQVVPAATLRRELRFKRLALIDLLRGLLVPVGTFSLAVLGFRYWALVGGALSSSVLGSVLTLSARTVPFAKPRWSELREGVSFSRDAVVGRLAWYFYSESDFIVAGRRLGESALGAYSLAWTLAYNPIEKVQSLLFDVSPAIMAAVQHDRLALRRYFLNMTEMLGLATLPVAFGTSVVSRELVAAVLGPKWEGVAAPLMLLSAYAGVRSITPLIGHALTAVRQSHYGMWVNVVTAILLPIGFIIGSRWGTVGIATAWILIHPPVVALQFRRAHRELGLSLAEYVQAVRLGLDGSLIMCAAVLATSFLLPSGVPALARLGIEVGVGALVFVSATLLLHRRRLQEIYSWFRRIRSPGALIVGS